MAASTYVVAATRAGQSAVVNETTTKTYAVAMPAVLQEKGTGGSGGGGGGTAVRVLVMA
jgi:hypothetical protein